MVLLPNKLSLPIYQLATAQRLTSHPQDQLNYLKRGDSPEEFKIKGKAMRQALILQSQSLPSQ